MNASIFVEKIGTLIASILMEKDRDTTRIVPPFCSIFSILTI